MPFVSAIKEPNNENFILMLSEMCDKYGQSPSDYLFNDLNCSHTRLVVDLTVFNIWADWKAEENKKVAAQARIARDANAK